MWFVAWLLAGGGGTVWQTTTSFPYRILVNLRKEMERRDFWNKGKNAHGGRKQQISLSRFMSLSAINAGDERDDAGRTWMTFWIRNAPTLCSSTCVSKAPLLDTDLRKRFLERQNWDANREDGGAWGWAEWRALRRGRKYCRWRWCWRTGRGPRGHFVSAPPPTSPRSTAGVESLKLTAATQEWLAHDRNLIMRWYFCEILLQNKCKHPKLNSTWKIFMKCCWISERGDNMKR